METKCLIPIGINGLMVLTPLLQTTVPGMTFLGRQDRELKDFEVILGMSGPTVVLSTPSFHLCQDVDAPVATRLSIQGDLQVTVGGLSGACFSPLSLPRAVHFLWPGSGRGVHIDTQLLLFPFFFDNWHLAPRSWGQGRELG